MALRLPRAVDTQHSKDGSPSSNLHHPFDNSSARIDSPQSHPPDHTPSEHIQTLRWPLTFPGYIPGCDESVCCFLCSRNYSFQPARTHHSIWLDFGQQELTTENFHRGGACQTTRGGNRGVHLHLRQVWWTCAVALSRQNEMLWFGWTFYYWYPWEPSPVLIWLFFRRRLIGYRYHWFVVFCSIWKVWDRGLRRNPTWHWLWVFFFSIQQ